MLKLSSVANHFALRCDAKYRLFWGMHKGTLFPAATVDVLPLSHAVVPFAARKAKKGDLEQELVLVELEDVEKRTGVIQSMHPVEELASDKIIFGTADLLTTRLRPYLGKTILNIKERRLGGTTEWIPLKLNHKLLSPLIAKYYLLYPRYVDNAERLLSGKEHPRVAEADILALRVPFLGRSEQEQLVNVIAEQEQKICVAMATTRVPEDIINDILATEFRFPLKEFRDRPRSREFGSRLSAMRDSFTLRSSVKFHQPDYEFVEEFLTRQPHEPVKAYISVPIRLGATASSADFIEHGEAYYVHPGATKAQERIDLEECYQVSQEFHDANIRSALRRGDVLINRSGEALGKVALFDSTKPAVASDFTMRVRFSDKMVPEFAWYFFRSVLFQSQIEREARGPSLKNIFPSQLERLLLVACDRKRQLAISGTIRQEMAGNEGIHNTIQKWRQEILMAIERAVRSSSNTTKPPSD
jgi:hypothetical protein